MNAEKRSKRAKNKAKQMKRRRHSRKHGQLYDRFGGWGTPPLGFLSLLLIGAAGELARKKENGE